MFMLGQGLRLGARPVISSRRQPATSVRGRDVVVQAKKEKKGQPKGGGGALAGLLKKKQEAEEAAARLAEQAGGTDRALAAQYADPEIRMLLFLVCQSYWKATKRYLMEDVDFESLPEALFRAPFALLVHNRFQEGVTDPEFIYANKAALTLWEATWDTLIGMPSAKSAPEDPNSQQGRQEFCQAAALRGVATGGEGWRISLTGQLFKIKGVTMFNVMDADGDKMAQAAVFNKYELEDGTECETTGEDPPPPPPRVSPADVIAAEEAANAQAEYVRMLKKQYSLTNKDPNIVAAVAELQSRRELVADLQSRVATDQEMELQAQWEAADRLFDEEEQRMEAEQQ